jgi:hypothetical protein
LNGSKVGAVGDFAVKGSWSITKGENHGQQGQEKRIKGQETATQAGTGSEVIRADGSVLN